jgi:hypothetical protein
MNKCRLVPYHQNCNPKRWQKITIEVLSQTTARSPLFALPLLRPLADELKSLFCFLSIEKEKALVGRQRNRSADHSSPKGDRATTALCRKAVYPVVRHEHDPVRTSRFALPCSPP